MAPKGDSTSNRVPDAVVVKLVNATERRAAVEALYGSKFTNRVAKRKTVADQMREWNTSKYPNINVAFGAKEFSGSNTTDLPFITLQQLLVRLKELAARPAAPSTKLADSALRICSKANSCNHSTCWHKTPHTANQVSRRCLVETCGIAATKCVPYVASAVPQRAEAPKKAAPAAKKAAPAAKDLICSKAKDCRNGICTHRKPHAAKVNSGGTTCEKTHANIYNCLGGTCVSIHAAAEIAAPVAVRTVEARSTQAMSEVSTATVNKKENTDMKNASIIDNAKAAAKNTVAAQKGLIVQAATLEAGSILRKQAVGLVAPKLPLMVRAYASTPLGEVVIMNLLGMAVKTAKPNLPENHPINIVTDAAVVGAYQDAIKQLDLESIIDGLFASAPLQKALGKLEGAAAVVEEK